MSYKLKYKTNLIGHTWYELRHLYGDLLYQIVLRRRRLGDPFMKYVMPSLTAALYLTSGNHLCFFVSKILIIATNYI